MTRDKEVLYQKIEQLDTNVVGTKTPSLDEDAEARAGELVRLILKGAVDPTTPLSLLYLYEHDFWYYVDDLWKIYIEEIHSSQIGEFPQSADYTIMNRTGDCEDIARAQYFIAQAFGFKPYMIIFLAKSSKSTVVGHAIDCYITSDKVWVHDFNYMFEFPKKSVGDIENIFYALSGYFDYWNLDPFSVVIVTFKPWNASYDKRMKVEDGFYIDIDGGDTDTYRGSNLYSPYAKKDMIVHKVRWSQDRETSNSNDFLTYLLDVLKNDTALQITFGVFVILLFLLLFKT